jgi:hypothetical protein
MERRERSTLHLSTFHLSESMYGYAGADPGAAADEFVWAQYEDPLEIERRNNQANLDGWPY